MALRVHKGKTNNRAHATAVRHASKQLWEAVARRSIRAGALLAMAVLLAMLGAGSFSSGAVTVLAITTSAVATPPVAVPVVNVPTVSTPAGTPAPLIHVPAQDRLVSVDPVLIDSNGLPTASRARVIGVGRKAKLSFTLTAGNRAAAIKALSVALPEGMAFSSSRKHLAKGIVVKTSGRRLKLTAKVSDGKLTIKLNTPAKDLQVTVVRPAITTTTTLARKVKTRHVKTLQIRVTATDMRHETAHIALNSAVK